MLLKTMVLIQVSQISFESEVYDVKWWYFQQRCKQIKYLFRYGADIGMLIICDKMQLLKSLLLCWFFNHGNSRQFFVITLPDLS